MPNPGPMTCPVDGAVLTMSERQGIEIDYCPSCRGVWLDRGELDKIIERANAGQAVQPAPPQAAPPMQPPMQHAPPQQPWGGQPGYPPQQGGYGQGKPYYGKRKKSFLEDLFD
jgi:Zn-finger nucleic acid-binding protein